MFRQLKVPVLGMIENMAFFDVVAYLRDRGGPAAHKLIDAKSFFDTPGDERVYIFGRGGARRKAEAARRPVPRRSALECLPARDRATPGRCRRPCCRARQPEPHLLGVVEQLAAQISIQNIKTPKMPKLESHRLRKPRSPVSVGGLLRGNT